MLVVCISCDIDFDRELTLFHANRSVRNGGLIRAVRRHPLKQGFGMWQWFLRSVFRDKNGKVVQDRGNVSRGNQQLKLIEPVGKHFRRDLVSLKNPDFFMIGGQYVLTFESYFFEELFAWAKARDLNL